MRLVMVMVIAVSGCVEPSVVTCENGLTCGAGLVCAHDLCVSQSAIDACDASANNAPCSFGDHNGFCSTGVCLEAVCGDGVRIGVEECDGEDFGTVHDCLDLGFYEAGSISCSKGCTIVRSACQHRCGDGILDADAGEKCDRMDFPETADSCDELGYYRPAPITCTPSCVPDLASCSNAGYCGDGKLDPQESCEPGPGQKAPAESCFDFGFDAGAVGCTSFCTADPVTCKYMGWKRAVPLTQNSFGEVIVSSAGNMMIAGDNGLVRVTNKVPGNLGPSQQPIAGIFGSATDLWLVGAEGYIGKFDGTTFTTQVAKTGTSLNDLKSVYAASPTSIYAVGWGRVLHDDGTNKWTTSQDNETNDATFDYRGVWGTGNDVYAVGIKQSAIDYTIWHYNPLIATTNHWANETITPAGTLTSPFLTDVWGIGGETFAIGGGNGIGMILRRNGTTWDREAFAPSRELNGIWGRAANDLYVVGDQGTISYYDGTWWELSTGLSTNLPLNGVGGAGPDVYATSALGGVFKDSHASWSFNVPNGGGRPVQTSRINGNTTYMLTRTNLLVKGNSGFVPLTTGAIATGDPIWNGTSANAIGMWHAAGNLFAILAKEGADTHVRTFNGSTWSETLPFTNKLFAAIAATSLSNIIIGGDGGELQEWNGSAWTTAAPAVSNHVVSAIAAVGTEVIAVGTNANGLAEIRRKSTGWAVDALTNVGGLNSVWAASATDVWAVGGPGNIVHFDGTTWTKVESPTPLDIKAISGSASVDTNGKANDVWAVGAGGGVFHYDGTAWTPVRVSLALDATNFEGVSVRAGLVLINEGSNVHAIVRTGTW